MRCSLDSRWVPVKAGKAAASPWRPSGSRCLVHEFPAGSRAMAPRRSAGNLLLLLHAILYTRKAREPGARAHREAARFLSQSQVIRRFHERCDCPKDPVRGRARSRQDLLLVRLWSLKAAAFLRWIAQGNGVHPHRLHGIELRDCLPVWMQTDQHRSDV